MSRILKELRADSDGEPFHLVSLEPGALDGMRYEYFAHQSPGPGQVEIAVSTAGLNFRDLMFVLGISPDMPETPIRLGGECAGRVVSIGNNVKRFQVGDEVMGVAFGSLGTHVVTDEHLIIHKPRNLSFEEAATVPIVFQTTYYAIHYLGQLRKGERILIHAGAGGIGQAAIQLAQFYGAEIFATAGSQKKREFLRTQGVKHVMDSRTLSFAEEIMDLTHGQGVNVVLNSLSGKFIHKSISVLSHFGRFLELGKQDFYNNTSIQLSPFRNNLSFFAIDLMQIFTERPEYALQLAEECMSLLSKGILKPIPYQVFPISEYREAFRLMRRSRHIGKIVLSLK